jgi:hypothetical protein
VKARILNCIGNIWIILACLLIIVGYISIVIFQGWDRLWDILSPFNIINIINWLAVVLILAPGIGLKMLASKIESREREYRAEAMLMWDKYDQKRLETLKDTSLGKVMTQVASEDPTRLPPEISQERLDAMERGPDFATLYDMGYRSLAYQDEVNLIVQQAQAQGAQILYNQQILNTLTYANIEGLKQQLAQINPALWQQIIENQGQITLKTEFWKFNERGEQINKGVWDIDYPPQSKMSQSELERYVDQQRFYNQWYWRQEAIEQRRKEREESWEYSHEKDLEGWKEYYAMLDSMKLYPDANDYWSLPGKFSELRRKWETTGGSMSWDAWLKQFDFEGEWYKLPPP